MHDVTIFNARICDGLGNPIQPGAVSITGDRISAVTDEPAPARQSIDAKGRVLAPGIVDTHTHYDAQITWDTTTAPSPSMGVTTIVMGNCGFGIAPCRPEFREQMLRNLTKVEGMPLPALQRGVHWNFESFGEYLDAIASRGTVANVAGFVGHACIRAYVMGEAASQRTATDEELTQMQAVLEQALEDGAIGIGTSTAESHNCEGGVPVPSRFAAEKEFLAFSDVMRKSSKGIWQITKGTGPSMTFLEQLATSANRPMQICPMLQDPGKPEWVFEEFAQIHDARSRGCELFGQVSPFPEVMEFNLHEPFMFESIRAWKRAMEANGTHAKMSIYQDPGFREKVKNELTQPGGPFRFSNQWVSMTILQSSDDELIGTTVAQIASQRGIHPLDCMLDIGIADQLQTQFRCEMFNADEAAVARLLDDEFSTLGLGDSGAHLTFFCQAGTGLYLLQRYVRERGDFPVEKAIQWLTSDSAKALRLPLRGELTRGYKADLFLFDPDTVGIGDRCWAADLPGGLERVHTPPLGVHGVWVNGQRVVDESGLLAESPHTGEVIRQFLN